MRRLPVAAGLVVLYMALAHVQMLVPLFSSAELSVLTEPAMLGWLFSMLGLVAIGSSVVAQRSLRIPVALWVLGCAIAVIGSTHASSTSGFLFAAAQLVGGPLVLYLLARRVPPSRTPLRREVGAALAVLGIGSALGTIWTYAAQLYWFSSTPMTALWLLELGLRPASLLASAALGVRAGRQLVHGRATAARALAQWLWFTLAVHGVFAVLAVGTFRWGDRAFSRGLTLQPLIYGALACAMPLVLARLGRRALAQPVAPREANAVPLVLAWTAAWFVPMLVAGAVLAQTPFATGLLEDAGPLRWMLVSAGCAVGALALLATAISVLRGAPVARLVTRIAAALSIGVLCYVAVVGWRLVGGPHSHMSLSVPVAAFALFTTAMTALAWFEARREHDLAPARTID